METESLVQIMERRLRKALKAGGERVPPSRGAKCPQDALQRTTTGTGIIQPAASSISAVTLDSVDTNEEKLEVDQRRETEGNGGGGGKGMRDAFTMN
ncbi:unnamed protein product [Merluccius merluccius]